MSGRNPETVARWCDLTRNILPAMAAEQSWPISLDHCFMRVCLDAALGSPWSDAVARPAIRSMSEAQLVAAVAVAESIVAAPGRLPALNAHSLRGRRSRAGVRRDEAVDRRSRAGGRR